MRMLEINMLVETLLFHLLEETMCIIQLENNHGKINTLEEIEIHPQDLLKMH